MSKHEWFTDFYLKVGCAGFSGDVGVVYGEHVKKTGILSRNVLYGLDPLPLELLLSPTAILAIFFYMHKYMKWLIWNEIKSCKGKFNISTPSANLRFG